MDWKDIQSAAEVLASQVVHTPLLHSQTFSQMFGGDVFLKLENMQKTGSFKIRGATVKINRVGDGATACGVIAASAGNHAQGVAFAAGRRGIPATIVMPETVSIAKQEATASYGGRVIIHGQNVGESLEKAREMAADGGMLLIHPFDDPDVIAGQATIGLEIIKSLPDPDLVVVPVGGGGLIAGIAAAVKNRNPRTRIIGVQAENCPSAVQALKKNTPVACSAGASVADGITVRKIGRRPFALIQNLVDDIVLVSEEDIAAAMLLLLERKKILVEGAGAVGLAALLRRRVRLSKGKRAVLVISGGNVDSQLLGRIVSKGLIQHGRIMAFRICLDDRPGALADMLKHVADLKANVVTISHTRNLRGIPLGSAYVDIELETRGREHIRNISNSLQKRGYLLESQGNEK